MTASTPEYMNCSPNVIGGLIETVSTALLSNFPKVSADPYDIELVLDALRVLRPRVTEIDTLDGILHMVRGHWDDAIHVLRQVGENAPRFGYAKALLAFCLSAKGDPDWKQCATEAMEINPSRDTQSLVRALEAREDLLNAMRVRRNGGQFVTPASCEALAEFNEQAEAAESTPEAPVAAAVAPAPLAIQMPHASFLRA
ncbi:HrpB1 family type III secretion system apparatus protein [Paraburkholderia phenazinium]|jgi:type III secretion protein HrpB1|uniref:Type III secretion protein HrpB1 n=1 Tax=Paraburkholderia phenazinium TaxID=60549 RepID=A0A1G8B7X1_9BURK|nr:HrpB1 family type III secretion system apparatus protein [Paraburkholderia phenazinium]SDH29339.1 type III secretion protein HrpB1 [Paraburkholderia phenazinium]